jgi:hypothetical protein
MNWKLIGKKTMLMSMHSGVKLGKKNHDKTFDFKNPPHWNPKWYFEPRPVYVVEVIPKFPDYPYSKQTFYVDAETFLIPFKECYDKKGDLWKVNINGFNVSEDMDTMPQQYGASVAIDFQAEHATAVPFNKFIVNSDLDHNMFTLSNLRKRGR